MKKAFLGLMLVVACLAGLPAYAATYTYDVDYTFAVTTTNKTGSITGFITTSCDDNCILTASNVLSWSFTASDGTSDSSSNPGSGINASGQYSPGDADGYLHGYQRHTRSVHSVLQRHREQRI